MKKVIFNKKICLYIRIWVKSLRAREDGNEKKEDTLLDQLDKIWLEMTPLEITEVDILSKQLVEKQINLNDLEKLANVGESPSIVRQPRSSAKKVRIATRKRSHLL